MYARYTLPIVGLQIHVCEFLCGCSSILCIKIRGLVGVSLYVSCMWNFVMSVLKQWPTKRRSLGIYKSAWPNSCLITRNSLKLCHCLSLWWVTRHSPAWIYTSVTKKTGFICMCFLKCILCKSSICKITR